MQINLITLNNIFPKRNQKIKENQRIHYQNIGTVNPFAQISKDTLEVTFTGKAKHCNEKDFQVKRIENLRCPACGLIMLTDDQINVFVEDVYSKKGEALASALTKYEDESVLTGKPSMDRTGHGVYRPIKKQVADVYKELAIKNPDKDLLELTKMQADACIDDLIERQMLVVDELNQYIAEHVENKTEREKLQAIVDKHTKQIKGESEEGFARKKFIFALKNAAVDKKIKNEIDKIVTKLPTSENNIDSFFVKYSKTAKTSKEVAKKFVNQTIPTTEHLVPRAKGGKDRLSNYICDCADCNSRRGHTEFYDWLQTLPGFEKRLQMYVNDVRIAIDNDELNESYDSYIDDVIETLSDISEGEVILEVPDVTNPKKNALVIAKREREIQQVRAHNEKLAEIANSIEAEIKELEKYQYFSEIVQQQEVINELACVDSEIERTNEELIKLRKTLNKLKKEIDEVNKLRQQEKDPVALAELEQEGRELKTAQVEAQREVVKNESNLEKLSKRKIKLKKQKKFFPENETKLKEEAEKLRSLIGRAEVLKAKIQKCGNYEQKEAVLVEELEKIGSRIAELNEENANISLNPEFNKCDYSDYTETKHLIELIRVADSLLANKIYKRTDIASKLAREVIETGKVALEGQYDEAKNRDTVKYFLNLDELKIYNERKALLEGKLSEQRRLKQEALTCKEQMNDLLKGEDIETVREKLHDITFELRTIEEIKKISSKKEKLEIIKKIVEKNTAQLKKLDDYERMKNAQYAYIMGFVNLEEIR